MIKSDGSRYEVPRAVRLSDARTASGDCHNGLYGTADVCYGGSGVLPGYVCETGSNVERAAYGLFFQGTEPPLTQLKPR